MARMADYKVNKFMAQCTQCDKIGNAEVPQLEFDTEDDAVAWITGHREFTGHTETKMWVDIELPKRDIGRAPDFDTLAMTQVNLIGEMTREQLTEEILATNREALASHDIHQLRHVVIQNRLETYRVKLFREAGFAHHPSEEDDD